MKKIIITSMLALSITAQAQQTKNGVYLSFEDYQNNKLSYSSECSEHHSINLHDAFNGTHISFKHADKKVKLYKDSIYGVQTCDKPLIRFQNNTSYCLEEKSFVWIFSIEETVYQNKRASIIKVYYFCHKGNETLLPLTVSNLKKEFPNNEKLQDLLDSQFKSNDASDYDSFHKTFKINHLINESNSKVN